MDATSLINNLLELVLALLALVVVAWRVSCLHALGVLGGIWQSEQLLLELGGNIDTGEMGSLCADSYLLAGLVS